MAPVPRLLPGPWKTPAFHDLLQLHLQGLDGSRWVITSRTLDPVNGEFPISHCGDVIVLEEDDPVGMFYDGTGARKTWRLRGGAALNSCRSVAAHGLPSVSPRQRLGGLLRGMGHHTLIYFLEEGH